MHAIANGEIGDDQRVGWTMSVEVVEDVLWLVGQGPSRGFVNWPALEKF